jgi:hypothetical protein
MGDRSVALSLLDLPPSTLIPVSINGYSFFLVDTLLTSCLGSVRF